MKKKSLFWIILLGLIIILMLESNLLFLRALSPKELDDVNPLIDCKQELLKEADILWIIPEYNGNPISEDKEWCNKIIALNKTLGMHGITHEYQEFLGNISSEEFEKAENIFEDCFHQKPAMFKPPQLKISEDNAILIKEYNLTIKNRFNTIIHKVYHCEDSGIFSNNLVEIF